MLVLSISHRIQDLCNYDHPWQANETSSIANPEPQSRSRFLTVLPSDMREGNAPSKASSCIGLGPESI